MAGAGRCRVGGLDRRRPARSAVPVPRRRLGRADHATEQPLCDARQLAVRDDRVRGHRAADAGSADRDAVLRMIQLNLGQLWAPLKQLDEKLDTTICEFIVIEVDVSRAALFRVGEQLVQQEDVFRRAVAVREHRGKVLPGNQALPAAAALP